MKIIISVTEKDIADGVPENDSLCPIALALKRKGIINVHVDNSTVEGKYRGHSIDTTLPTEAQVFVKRFDKSKTVKPFRFVLKTPD